MIVLWHDYDQEPLRPWNRGARVQVGPGPRWRLIYTTEYDLGIILRNVAVAVGLAAERQRGQHELHAGKDE